MYDLGAAPHSIYKSRQYEKDTVRPRTTNDALNEKFRGNLGDSISKIKTQQDHNNIIGAMNNIPDDARQDLIEGIGQHPTHQLMSDYGTLLRSVRSDPNGLTAESGTNLAMLRVMHNELARRGIDTGIFNENKYKTPEAYEAAVAHELKEYNRRFGLYREDVNDFHNRAGDLPYLRSREAADQNVNDRLQRERAAQQVARRRTMEAPLPQKEALEGLPKPVSRRTRTLEDLSPEDRRTMGERRAAPPAPAPVPDPVAPPPAPDPVPDPAPAPDPVAPAAFPPPLRAAPPHPIGAVRARYQPIQDLGIVPNDRPPRRHHYRRPRPSDPWYAQHLGKLGRWIYNRSNPYDPINDESGSSSGSSGDSLGSIGNIGNIGHMSHSSSASDLNDPLLDLY
jgi:hypothetical protein